MRFTVGTFTACKLLTTTVYLPIYHISKHKYTYKELYMCTNTCRNIAPFDSCFFWNGVFKSIAFTTEHCIIILLEKIVWTCTHYDYNSSQCLEWAVNGVHSRLHLCIGLHVLQKLSQQRGGEGQVSHPELLQTLQPACATHTAIQAQWGSGRE